LFQIKPIQSQKTKSVTIPKKEKIIIDSGNNMKDKIPNVSAKNAILTKAFFKDLARIFFCF
jgi:hypothetical protein